MDERERATSRDGGVASSDEDAEDGGKYDRYVEYLLDLLSFF